MALLMVFSRLVLGAHSLNQVLYGSLLGYWTVSFIISFLRPFLLSHIKKVVSKILDPEILKFYLAVASLIYFNVWTSNFWVYFYLDYTDSFGIDFTNINRCLESKGE